MWQAEAAQVAIKLGRMLLPSLRASEEASGLLLEGGTLAKSAKSVSGLPGMSIESAGAEIATLGKVAKPVDMHVSALPELKLRDIDPGTSWKPNGLWTSDKLAWVPKEGPISSHDVVRGFAHHVDTSEARMFEVASRDGLQSLLQRFGKPSPFPSKLDGKINLGEIDLAKIGKASEPELRAFRNSDVDWREMSKSFDGIRFSNFRSIKSEGPVPSWFDGLDLSSSVTWNNVNKVRATPLGKVPSYYEPAFHEKLNALIAKAGQL